MKKVIISVALVLLVGTSYASVTPVQNDVANIKGAVPAGTPSVGVSYEQKGFVGHLLGEIFELSGHIKNQFIVAFQNIDRDFANTVPKWDGQKFVEGSITDRNGNIGIGTSNPQAKLHVNGLMRGNSFYAQSNTEYKYISGGDTSDRGGNILMYGGNRGASSNDIHMRSNSIPRLKIEGSSGNVGIGTTNPQAKLHVNGRIIASNPTQNSHVATKGYVDNRMGRVSNYSQHSLYLGAGSYREQRLGTKDICVFSGFKTWADDSNMYDGCRVTRRSGTWYLELRKSDSDSDPLRCYASCFNL